MHLQLILEQGEWLVLISVTELLQIPDEEVARDCSAMDLDEFNAPVIRDRSNDRSVACVDIALINMQILVASAPVLILKSKLGEVRLVKVHDLPSFIDYTIKLLNEILPLRIKLLLIQGRQVLFLAHLLSLYLVFQV